MPRVPLTKIVATIGPATSSPNQIDALIKAGVDVVRMNFSHGTHDDHQQVFDTVRTTADQQGRQVAILQDLQGPKLRVGELVDGGPVMLQDDHEFRICTRSVNGTAFRVSTSYEHLGRDIQLGDAILLDDGNIELRVDHIDYDTEFGDDIATTVIHGGPLKPRKGINLPDTVISAPSLTEKDIEDLAFGVSLGVDVIALSFVREASDIQDAKSRIHGYGGTQPVIAKIEKPQAVANLQEIVDASDGVMVARGDLAVEMSPEDVPLIQKRLIKMANRAGIPVITATQMLESMIDSPRPTRAEASDVANAVFDGSDAVMLSGETAVGAYPIEAVGIMRRIANRVEQDSSWAEQLRHETPDRIIAPDAVAAAHAAASLAASTRAEAIAVLTESGHTARRVSQARPGVQIVALTAHEPVANRLSLFHGVLSIVDPLEGTIEGVVRRVEHHIRERNVATSGETIIVVGAVPRQSGDRAVFLEIHHLD